MGNWSGRVVICGEADAWHDVIFIVFNILTVDLRRTFVSGSHCKIMTLFMAGASFGKMLFREPGNPGGGAERVPGM